MPKRTPSYRQRTGYDQAIVTLTDSVTKNRMRQLFDVDRLAPLLIETPPAQGLDPQMRAMYEAAQTAAAEAPRDSKNSGSAPPDVKTGNGVGSGSDAAP
jgi:hypothetical protein